jgi:hypothetical protein
MLAAYLAAFALAAWYLARRYKRFDLDRMPAPSWTEWFQLVSDQPRCYDFFRRWHEKYGPVFRLWLVYREFVMVADPEIAAQILGKGPQYVHQKAPEYSAINPVSVTDSHMSKPGLQMEKRNTNTSTHASLYATTQLNLWSWVILPKSLAQEGHSAYGPRVRS